MPTSGERLLIVKTSSMGDVVHAAPLAADLARRFPSAAIDWLVEEGFAAIPRMHRPVDRVITVAVRRWRRAPLAASTWREGARRGNSCAHTATARSSTARAC